MTDRDDCKRLADCPIGLFMSQSGELCLKTEYGSNEGRIDAYIVSSGEFFWGGVGAGPDAIAKQRNVMVRPIDQGVVVSAPRAASVKAGEVVAVRPLEWRDHSFEDDILYTAWTPWTDYRITFTRDYTWPWTLKPFIAEGSNYQTLDTAKAAAQADYEVRLRSALVVEPAASAGAMALPSEGRQFIADSGCDEDDQQANEHRDDLLRRIDTALAANQSDGGPTLEMETRRADDNGRSCKHFCEALRQIASGDPNAIEIAATAIRMPWLHDQYGSSDTAPAEPVAMSRDWRTIEEQIASAQGHDLLSLLRGYLEINLEPGNDLAPLYIARINAILATHPPRSVDVEAIARVIGGDIFGPPDDFVGPATRYAREAALTKARSIAAMIEGE